MKTFLVFFIIAILFLPLAIPESDSLRQRGGLVEMEINPGETKTFEWTLISSDEEGNIILEIGSFGWGDQFLSFPESLELGPLEGGTIEISVTIPSDHPGGVVIEPTVTATEFGEAGGSTSINIIAGRLTSITILPNANPEFRTNTAYDEPIKEIVEAEQTPEIEKEEFTSSPLEITQETEPEEEEGGCLIATATYGSEMAQQVQMLREIRDTKLLTTSSGTSFMKGFNQFYYTFSPTIADMERENPVFKEAVKLTITPLITSLSILNYVDMDSEEKVLGYGISLILLNAGMYFVAPAIVITKLRKRF